MNPHGGQLLQIKLVQKERLNPRVDYTKNYNHFAGARYIIECGIKLKANVLTIATAATFYHKFFSVTSLEEYDPYLIGSTCIYLASKVEDDDIKIRDIINVGISCVRRGDPPLALDPYFSMRDSLIQAELLLMRVLGFKMKVDLPHKYILHYLLSLKEWLGSETFDTLPMVHLVWTLLQDVYHSPLVLEYAPQLIAATIINIALQVYGVVVPGDDEINDRSWFTVLHPDCTFRNVWELTTQILQVYKQEEDLVMERDAMGTLGCPLCCRQHFESVGTLREHLIYYIYRPLQCEVCCLHLAGVQEFTHHLRCHMGEELPSTTKLPCTKPSLTTGESDCQDSPLPTITVGQDGGGTDSDAGISTAHPSDDYSSYMKGSDAANQMLKLREWQLEKLGKNFSRHRAFLGKSPGLLERSPASGKVNRSSTPTSVKDLTRDRRPSSQNSSYTPHPDTPVLNKDIDSVERCDSSATPLSVYGNVGSVGLSDHSACPQSVEKDVVEESLFHSPAQPVIAAHPLQQTTSCTEKQTDLPACLVQDVPSPSITSGGEKLPTTMNFQDYDLPESNMSCDLDVNQPPRVGLSPSLYVPSTQDTAFPCLQSSRNAFETIQDYDICGTDFTEPLNKTQDIDGDIINTEQYESSRLPVLETVNSSDLNENQSPQYHELQTVSFNKELEASETVPGLSDIWPSCPNTSNATPDKPLESLNKSQLKIKDTFTLTESQFSGLKDNFSNKTNIYSFLSSNNDGRSFQPEVIDSGRMTENIHSDDTTLHDDSLREIRNPCHFSEGDYEDQVTMEGGCDGPYSSLVDTRPYLHKKFHHDQERKLLPSSGVEQVADVSQYINSFQSVLVRKLNGTLSNNIPMSSSMCSTSVMEPKKEVTLEEPHQSHQPQTKDHICEVCDKTFKTSSAFQLHSKEHEKGEDLCGKDLYRKCPKDTREKKRKKKDQFQCDQCSKVFPSAFNFSRHVREVHVAKKSFACVQCNKTFSCKRNLEEHSGIHKSEKIHKCSKCDHQCYTASGLRTHIQEIHSLGSEQRVHCCKVCGEKFAKTYGLKRHTLRKHTEQQLKCSICSKTFTCKEDLNKHNKSHSNTVKLKCDNCDKTFTTSWALQRHLKTHQSQYFKCNVCNLKFTRKDSLVSHLHSHSQRKQFLCHCGKRFIKKSQLNEHQVKHSSVSKYTCPVCKHSYKFKVSLKNHSCKKSNVQTK